MEEAVMTKKKKGMAPAEMSEDTWELFFSDLENDKSNVSSDGRKPTGFFTKTGTALDVRNENMLVRMAQSGDRIAFGALYEMHREKVYKHLWYMVGNKEDALDLTTDSFIKAMDSVSKFRSESSFLTWMFAISSRTAIDFLRKKRFVTLPLALFHSLTAKEIDIPDEIDKERRLAAIMNSLDILSPKERAVFTIRYIENKSLSQTAEILELAEGTIKTLYHRSINKLKKRLRGKL